MITRNAAPDVIERIALTQAWRGAPSDSFSDILRLTQEALRSTLPGSQRTPARDEEVRRILRQLCNRARDANLHAEDVIILLKHAWSELPEARPALHDRDGTLAHVVTLSIEEYYSPTAKVSHPIGC